MAERFVQQGSSIIIDGKVRRSLKPNLRPTSNNEVIDLTAEPTFVELMQLEKLERLQKYASLGMTSSQMTAAANNFDAVNKEKMISLLVDEVFTNHKSSEIIDAIRKAKVNSLSGNNALYNSVTYLHSQNIPYFDIAAELSQRRTVILREQEAQDAADARQAIKDEETHTGDAIRAMANGDSARFKVAVDKLNSLDPEAAAKLESDFQAVGSVRKISVDTTVSRLDGLRRQLSYGDVLGAKDDLSLADFNKYLKLVETYESAEVSIAESWLKGELKLTGDLREIAFDNPMFEKSQLYASLVGKLALAKLNADRSGVNFDAIATAESLLGTQADEIDEAQFLALQKNASGLINILNQQKGAELELDDYSGAIEFLEDIQTRLKAGERIQEYKKDSAQKQIPNQIERLKKAIR